MNTFSLGGGVYSENILVGCAPTYTKRGLRNGYNPKKGFLGTGTMQKRAFLEIDLVKIEGLRH